MKAKKILFATDFSTTANEALEFAATLAKESGAKLLIVHVAELPMAYGTGEMYYGLPEPDTTELHRMLKEVVPTHPAVVHEHRMLSGNPASEIVELAKAEDVDLIVLSTHGRTGLTRALMGSVAEVVVRRATCPVLTLKAKQPAPTGAKAHWRP
jgi:nucleotide-binding universal stress UspA family protein